MKRPILLTFVLVASQALAADGWSITRKSGTSVMNEISTLTFTIANTGTAGSHPLNRIVLQLNETNYDIDGAHAPPGWNVSAIDKANKKVTFDALGTTCPRGLVVGQAADFQVRVIGASANADVSGETFVRSKTTAKDVCSRVSFPSYAGSPTWKRVSLAAQMSVSPRTLDLQGSVTVTLSVTNRSNATQTLLAAMPQQAPATLFGFTSGPVTTPSPLTLATGQSGTVSWTFEAHQRGVTIFSSAAQNGTGSVTSPAAQSLEVDVGVFPGSIVVTPSGVSSGSNVTVQLTVSNNSADAYTEVAPNPLTIGGTASVTKLSGPIPVKVSTLAPGGSTSFAWTYSVSGVPGDTFSFVGDGTALRNGVPLSSDPVGSAAGTVVVYTVTPSPTALLTGSINRNIAYTIFNGGAQPIRAVRLLTPDISVFKVAANPFAADTSGWSGNTGKSGYTFTAPTGQALATNQSKTFTISYASVGPVSQATTYSHKWVLTNADATTARAEGQVTLFISRILPEVGALVALARNGMNTLIWSNPSDHDGTMVVRSALGPVTAAPTPGTQYSVGQWVGPAGVAGSGQVIYSDTLSFASSFDDTGRTNGTRYDYKVYNHDPHYIYSSGNVPSSTGIFSIPTAGGAGTGVPAWCFNTGFSSTLQPMIDYGAGAYSASNAGFVTGEVSSLGGTTDGTEKWRPVVLQGAVQSRFQVVPLANRSGTYIVVGDQSGRATVINAANGSVAFRGQGGAQLGTRIQAQPAVQLVQYSSAAFKAAFPATDLLFFATADSGTGNRVWALKSWDPTNGHGSVAWTYAPGDLGMMSGGMVLDYVTDTLWIASRSGGVGSLRALSSLNGTLKAAWNVGSVDLPLSYDFSSKQIYVTNSAGVVYGFDATLTALTQPVWQYTTGTLSNYAFPTGRGFIASLSGSLQWFKVASLADGGTDITTLWPTAPAISQPSGVRVDYITPQKIYVGDSAGVLHQIDAATGVEDVSKRRQIGLAGMGLGTPTIDPYFAGGARRLYVNGIDGRLCAIDLPY